MSDPITVLTYADLARDALSLVPWCLARDVSAVYGVPRSGMLPATMLACALGVPCGVAGEAAHGGSRQQARPRNATGPALLVDDSINHGGAMKRAVAYVEARTGARPLTAAIYARAEVAGLVDCVARQVEAPRWFEWNIFGCDAARFMAFDLDGVFCPDVPVREVDGEPEYEACIAALPCIRPTTFPVGWIVTNRIERFRATTETWLIDHGIEVAHDLVMQPFATADARREASPPGAWKAHVYASLGTGCWLFIESHDAIACEIHERTGRAVLSLQSWRVWQ